MLSPMIIQRLVGLCCARGNPEAVEVIVGSMVYDTTAEKTRDVDVTVTIAEPGGVSGILAYEVKHEKTPLDLPVVEGLCAKLVDMKQLTSRAVVSTSSYTQTAMRKAAAWGVKLYTLRKWDQPLSRNFPAFSDVDKIPADFLRLTQVLLQWRDFHSFLLVPDAEPFNWGLDMPVFNAKGKPHIKYKTIGALLPVITLRSTNSLLHVPPASEHVSRISISDVSPWPFAHTLDVRADNLFLKVGSTLRQVHSWTLSGQLGWDKRHDTGDYYVMESADGNSLFAGAAIGGGPPGDRMIALIFEPNSRELLVSVFELLEKHKHAIRDLKIDLPARSLSA